MKQILLTLSFVIEFLAFASTQACGDVVDVSCQGAACNGGNTVRDYVYNLQNTGDPSNNPAHLSVAILGPERSNQHNQSLSSRGFLF